MSDTETTLERTVREEQEDFETTVEQRPHGAEPGQQAPEDGSGLPPAAEGTQLFDDTDYEREDLALPKIDGESIDRIAIKVSGTVFLDRSDPNDVALYRSLRFGSDRTIMVEARVSGTGAKGATDREGDLDVVVGEKTLKVHTVYRPAGQDAA